MSQARWARLESSVNLGPWGNPDPYFVSLDLLTARHPQTLLAAHLERKASHRGAWSSAETACTCEIRPEEHQGHYPDHLYEGRTAGLLGKARVFTLRRSLNPSPETTRGKPASWQEVQSNCKDFSPTSVHSGLFSG